MSSNELKNINALLKKGVKEKDLSKDFKTKYVSPGITVIDYINLLCTTEEVICTNDERLIFAKEYKKSMHIQPKNRLECPFFIKNTWSCRLAQLDGVFNSMCLGVKHRHCLLKEEKKVTVICIEDEAKEA